MLTHGDGLVSGLVLLLQALQHGVGVALGLGVLLLHGLVECLAQGVDGTGGSLPCILHGGGVLPEVTVGGLVGQLVTGGCGILGGQQLVGHGDGHGGGGLLTQGCLGGGHGILGGGQGLVGGGLGVQGGCPGGALLCLGGGQQVVYRGCQLNDAVALGLQLVVLALEGLLCGGLQRCELVTGVLQRPDKGGIVVHAAVGNLNPGGLHGILGILHGLLHDGLGGSLGGGIGGGLQGLGGLGQGFCLLQVDCLVGVLQLDAVILAGNLFLQGLGLLLQLCDGLLEAVGHLRVVLLNILVGLADDAVKGGCGGSHGLVHLSVLHGGLQGVDGIAGDLHHIGVVEGCQLLVPVFLGNLVPKGLHGLGGSITGCDHLPVGGHAVGDLNVIEHGLQAVDDGILSNQGCLLGHGLCQGLGGLGGGRHVDFLVVALQQLAGVVGGGHLLLQVIHGLGGGGLGGLHHGVVLQLLGNLAFGLRQVGLGLGYCVLSFLPGLNSRVVHRDGEVVERMLGGIVL